jgi:hypothetical protein
MALGRIFSEYPRFPFQIIIQAIIPPTHYYGDRKIPTTTQSGEPGHEIELRPSEYEQMLTKRRTVS